MPMQDHQHYLLYHGFNALKTEGKVSSNGRSLVRGTLNARDVIDPSAERKRHGFNASVDNDGQRHLRELHDCQSRVSERICVSRWYLLLEADIKSLISCLDSLWSTESARRAAEEWNCLEI